MQVNGVNVYLRGILKDGVSFRIVEMHKGRINIHSYLLGLYSLSRKTSYRQISRSLEAARLIVIMIVSIISEIWQTSRQRRRWGALQISERLNKFKPESRGLEI